MLAVRIGSLECVRVLTEFNADLNARNSDGNTALHLAVANANYSIVQDLLQAGCNPKRLNRAGLTPLDTCYEIAEIDCQIKVLITNVKIPFYRF